jgi:integrase
MDQWLETQVAQVRESTMRSYRQSTKLYVVPFLGAIKLQRLRPSEITSWAAKLNEGRRPKTVRIIFGVLRKALADAVDDELIESNPALRAKLPRPESDRELEVWDPHQLRRYLELMTAHRLAAAYRLCATTGMRRGEVLGLRWSDINLDAGWLDVRQTATVVGYAVVLGEPKTARSRRRISLGPTTVAALRGWRADQLRERLAVGPRYTESGLVFTKPDGSHVHPDSFSQTHDRLVAR